MLNLNYSNFSRFLDSLRRVLHANVGAIMFQKTVRHHDILRIVLEHAVAHFHLNSTAVHTLAGIYRIVNYYTVDPVSNSDAYLTSCSEDEAVMDVDPLIDYLRSFC